MERVWVQNRNRKMIKWSGFRAPNDAEHAYRDVARRAMYAVRVQIGSMDVLASARKQEVGVPTLPSEVHAYMRARTRRAMLR